MHLKLWTFLMCAALAAGLMTPAVAAETEPLLSIQEVDALPYGTPVYGVSTLGPNGLTRFTCKLLDVMHNTIGPGHNWIVVELIDEATPVVAGGQSGSPMYVEKDGVSYKIGTLSYADTFARRPIAYLTPIHEVLRVKEYESTSGNPASQQAVARHTRMLGIQRVQELVEELLPEDNPLRMSMMAGTVSSGVAVGGDPDPVQPGSLVGVQLAWGDFDWTSYGTVAHVDGDYIYMYGHPHYQLGPTEYRLVPMRTLAVQEKYDRSYILAAPVEGAETLGVITQDRETAIFGKLGQQPEHAFPVRISITTSSGAKENFLFHTITDPIATPIVAGVGVAYALQSYSRRIGDLTLFAKGKIEVDGLGDVEFSESYTNAAGPFMLIRERLAKILTNRFSRARIEGIQLEARIFDEYRKLGVDTVTIEQPTIRPGDTIKLRINLSQPMRDPKVITLEIPTPENLQYGEGKIVIGDQSVVNRAERSSGNVVNLATLVENLNQKRRPDAVYVYVVMPPSRADAEESDGDVDEIRVGDITAQVRKTSKRLSSNVEEFEIGVSDFMVSGSRTVEFKVRASLDGSDNPHH